MKSRKDLHSPYFRTSQMENCKCIMPSSKRDSVMSAQIPTSRPIEWSWLPTMFVYCMLFRHLCGCICDVPSNSVAFQVTWSLHGYMSHFSSITSMSACLSSMYLNLFPHQIYSYRTVLQRNSSEQSILLAS